jgi:hypothetical protein
MFVGKAMSLPKASGREKCFTDVGLISKHWTKLERLAGCQHPSLFVIFIIEEKSFITLITNSQKLHNNTTVNYHGNFNPTISRV